MLSRDVGGAPPGAACPEHPRRKEGGAGRSGAQPSSPGLVLLRLSLSNSTKSNSALLGRPPTGINQCSILQLTMLIGSSFEPALYFSPCF